MDVPYSVFRAFLQYLYTDRIELSPDAAVGKLYFVVIVQN
jgi:hypothetical protein